ncbi:MAG: addiction module protein [Bryobacteraceae bacterium]|jgi:putative addiction module component (TIGR02574 family)
MNPASIFDLSPSEKLQLVEDLWDDLASAPVHDWQKQELARRKSNLLKNPALGLPWEEVKGQGAVRNCAVIEDGASAVPLQNMSKK